MPTAEKINSLSNKSYLLNTCLKKKRKKGGIFLVQYRRQIRVLIFVPEAV